MRLIDGDALKKEFPKDTDWEYPVNTNCYVCEIIDSQPTVEPERKTGKWIKDRLISTNGGTYPVYRCSECEAYYQETGYGWNYCPNCGADMRGGET